MRSGRRETVVLATLVLLPVSDRFLDGMADYITSLFIDCLHAPVPPQAALVANEWGLHGYSMLTRCMVCFSTYTYLDLQRFGFLFVQRGISFAIFMKYHMLLPF